MIQQRAKLQINQYAPFGKYCCLWQTLHVTLGSKVGINQSSGHARLIRTQPQFHASIVFADKLADGFTDPSEVRKYMDLNVTNVIATT